jgi:cation diffusion facilitator family transporter
MNGEVRRTLAGVVLVSIVVAVARIVGGRLLGALGVEADGWHTLGDTVALGLAFAGLGFASAGTYGRLERWITGALALLMLAVTVELAFAAIVADASDVELSATPLALLLPTVAIQFALVRYQKRAAARTGSLLLDANAAHTRADAMVTAAILLGAALAAAGLPWIDRLTAIGVAIAIASSAVALLRRAARGGGEQPTIGRARAAGQGPG